jgi:hypothetical protein
MMSSKQTCRDSCVCLRSTRDDTLALKPAKRSKQKHLVPGSVDPSQSMQTARPPLQPGACKALLIEGLRSAAERRRQMLQRRLRLQQRLVMWLLIRSAQRG